MRTAEQKEAAIAAHRDDLRNSVSTLGSASAAMSRSLTWCRKELKTSRRMLWREQARCRALEAKQQELSCRLDAASSSAAALESRVHALWAAADQSRRELAALHGSKFWLLTTPLRSGIRRAHACAGRLRQIWRSIVPAPRRLGALLLDQTVTIVRRRSWLKRSLLLALGSIPGLRERAVRVGLIRSGSVAASGAGARVLAVSDAIDCDAMPASTERVYRQIFRARAVHSTS